MTNNGVLERPKNKAKVIALILDGKTDAEIAALIATSSKTPVSRQSVHGFRKRHADEIAPAVEKLERELIDYAIANKVNRIADAQTRRDLMVAVKEARAKGGDGMETGIVARQYKMVGTGRNAEMVEEFKVDTAFLAEWRANDRHVSEELDQLPRGKGGDLNIDNRVQVLVRQYGGFDPNAID